MHYSSLFLDIEGVNNFSGLCILGPDRSKNHLAPRKFRVFASVSIRSPHVDVTHRAGYTWPHGRSITNGANARYSDDESLQRMPFAQRYSPKKSATPIASEKTDQLSQKPQNTSKVHLSDGSPGAREDKNRGKCCGVVFFCNISHRYHVKLLLSVRSTVLILRCLRGFTTDSRQPDGNLMV